MPYRPTLDEAEQLLVVGRLRQRDAHLRPGSEETVHHLREDPLTRTLEDADAKRSRLALAERVEIGLGGRDPRRDCTGVGEQEGACLGEGDRLGAARPLDQPVADDPLERGDLLADRRLRIPESRRGLAERALARDRFQSQEVPQLDP